GGGSRRGRGRAARAPPHRRRAAALLHRVRAMKTVSLVVLLALALPAPGRADPFLDQVVQVTIGTGGGAGAPEKVLGPPRGGGALQGPSDTPSPRLGGQIVVEVAGKPRVYGPGGGATP